MYVVFSGYPTPMLFYWDCVVSRASLADYKSRQNKKVTEFSSILRGTRIAGDLSARVGRM